MYSSFMSMFVTKAYLNKDYSLGKDFPALQFGCGLFFAQNFGRYFFDVVRDLSLFYCLRFTGHQIKIKLQLLN